MARINPVFESHTGIKVNTITAGSGHALRLGREGDVDVLLTHSPDAEKRFINEGYGLKRYPVMHNDFVIVGPSSDPAGIVTADTAETAMAMIANNKVTFISRDDDSGTHRAELALWQGAGLTPGGDGYIRAGIGMGQALMLASDKGGYTLSDRGTFLAYSDRINLGILFESRTALRNSYHVFAVNPDRHPDTQHELT